MTTQCPAAVHDTPYAAQRYGCRCAAALEAKHAYRRAAGVRPMGSMVPARPYQRMLDDLVQAVTQTRVAAYLGVSDSRISDMRRWSRSLTMRSANRVAALHRLVAGEGASHWALLTSSQRAEAARQALEHAENAA